MLNDLDDQRVQLVSFHEYKKRFHPPETTLYSIWRAYAGLKMKEIEHGISMARFT
jgi:hypothetical protein